MTENHALQIIGLQKNFIELVEKCQAVCIEDFNLF